MRKVSRLEKPLCQNLDRLFLSPAKPGRHDVRFLVEFGTVREVSRVGAVVRIPYQPDSLPC
ncbi:MAG: hypothetical protein CMN76_02985 [Spirochaetaceae bacterium]|nr:hypothetical protein [Spirochaetaceae bacterium]|tara:strand:- start:30388 stop:30570 length:183 start_codon:yes stop_codon:yes gene_type:complete